LGAKADGWEYQRRPRRSHSGRESRTR
jgi:hypothetical protein